MQLLLFTVLMTVAQVCFSSSFISFNQCISLIKSFAFQLCSVFANELSLDTNGIPNVDGSTKECKKMNENVNVILEAYPNNVFVNESVLAFVSEAILNRLILLKEKLNDGIFSR